MDSRIGCRVSDRAQSRGLTESCWLICLTWPKPCMVSWADISSGAGQVSHGSPRSAATGPTWPA